MRAVIHRRYGSPEVLELQQTPMPQPAEGEVLVKVHATTVNRTDCGMLRAHPFFMRPTIGVFKPEQTILGMDFAGEVVALGEGVSAFASGDRVFGMSPKDFGAHAEYLCVPAQGAIATMPAGLRFDQVVACEGAWYAHTYLEEMAVGPGQRILIYGASGAIGTAAVQLAKARGAFVTAVVSTRHLELMKTLGADRVIDYTAREFTQLALARENQQRSETFDFVLDAVGKTTFFHCRKLLAAKGVFAATDLGPWWQNLVLAFWFSLIGSRRVVMPMPKNSETFVGFLKARMEAGEFRAVVDRKYPFEEIVDAFRYVEEGQKTGIVVIEVVAKEAEESHLATRRRSA